MRRLIICSIILFFSGKAFAQNVGIGTTNPKASAALDISSNNKGLLIPRTSTGGRTGIAAPAKGLMVYDTTYSAFFYYDGGKWRPMYEQNYDSAVVDYGNEAANGFNLPTATEPTAEMVPYENSGFIYDDGGPGGNYSANNFSYAVVVDDGLTLGYKIKVEEMNVELGYDTVFILLNYSGNNTFDTLAALTGTQVGNYTVNNSLLTKKDLFGIVICLKANGINQFPGFKIRWSRIRINNTNQTSAPSYGWHFDSQKMAAAGGIQLFNNWHTDSTGHYSFSYGYGNKAKGRNSLAIGDRCNAIGERSIAMGNSTNATGDNSIATGYFTNATGYSSVAMGYLNNAAGSGAVALGRSNSAIGRYSTALGESTKAIGYSSTAMGHFTSVTGENATAMGEYTSASGYSSLAIGMYNDSIVLPQGETNQYIPLFIIGNGDAINNRSNAMAVFKSGKVAIGNNRNPSGMLHITDGDSLSVNNSSGFMTIGNTNSTNIVFDEDEIQARNNEAAADLRLQKNGGQIMIGRGNNPNRLLSVNGGASKPGGGSWDTYSDRRLKQNISPYSDGLSTLLKINPVWYHYNAASGFDVSKQYVGVIAQELQKISPYMVEESVKNKAADGSGYLSVDNSAMTYMLINAVKEQQQQIEVLKNTNATLLNRIEKLEAKQ